MSLRHNEVRDITVKFLEEVCKDVRKKSMLMGLNGEQFRVATANKDLKLVSTLVQLSSGLLVNEYFQM